MRETAPAVKRIVFFVHFSLLYVVYNDLAKFTENILHVIVISTV